MASFVSTPIATLPWNSTTSQLRHRVSLRGPMASGLRLVPQVKVTTIPFSHRFSNTAISCSLAQPETLKAVQTTIAKQLSIDENCVTPSTKFADLGADSLDTVEIMMALEETFEVSIGESGAGNISTVQDAVDLIEKMKTAA